MLRSTAQPFFTADAGRVIDTKRVVVTLMDLSMRRGLAVSYLAILALGGCATISAPLPDSATAGYVRQANVQETPVCRGQKTHAEYASVVEAILRKPSKLCVPAFKGFGGFIGFPATHPPGKLELMASDKPIHNGLPKLKGVGPVFYLEWDPGWQMTFGKIAPAGGIFGKSFIPGHVYTAYGIGYKDGGHDDVGPCYSVVFEGKYGGVFRNLGSLVTGHSDSIFSWTLGIYPGKEAADRCGR